MKKPLLKLLILSTLIYANTYNTKAENTLHSTSTDRCATAKYWKKHERFRLLKEGIKAVVVCFILYCLWQYISSERDLVGAKIASSIAGKSNDSEVITFVGGTDLVGAKIASHMARMFEVELPKDVGSKIDSYCEGVKHERIRIKGKSYDVLLWDKTKPFKECSLDSDDFKEFYFLTEYQYKVEALDGKNDQEYICKKYAIRKGVHRHLKLNTTGAVPKIIECYPLPPSYKDREHFLCVMEYPSRKSSLLKKMHACIEGLKKINKECIKYLNIEPFDMVEHCFIHFDNRDNGKHSEEKEEKNQIISLARSVLADEYREEIFKLFKQKFPKRHKNEINFLKGYDYLKYISFQINRIEEDSQLVEEIKRLYSTEFVANKEKRALLPVLAEAGKGEIETLEDFFRQISLQVGVGEDTAEKILSYYWRREVDKKKINDINNTIFKYCN